MPAPNNFYKLLQSVEDRSVRKSVLLGNGFSRACRDSIFSYSALFEKAKGAVSDELGKVFASLKTTDFEAVMRALQRTSEIVQVYNPNTLDVCSAMRRDAEQLKDVLVDVIANSHPERPSDIDNTSYANTWAFIKQFSSIFTLNYDLLLYWTQMSQNAINEYKDCFFKSPLDSSCLSWANRGNDQNIYYLHGALHLYDIGLEVRKRHYSESNGRLIDQIRKGVASDEFPLFVSEGTSSQKLDRILHNPYLAFCLQHLSDLKGALFVHGLSMGEGDEHIMDVIQKSRISQLCVGLHGSPTSQTNEHIQARVEKIKLTRSAQRPLQIDFYDSGSAKLWG